MNITELLKEINPHYIEDLQKPDHHSIFINEGQYTILIIRGLDVSKDGLQYVSKGIVIDKDKHVFFYNHEEENLEAYTGGLSKLYELISPIYSQNRNILNSYIFEIDELEDSLFERKTSRIFMDVWFDVKKDLARVERHVARNFGILKQFCSAESGGPEFQEIQFRDILTNIQLDQQDLKNQIIRLDALYNYYGSIKNDKLNKNIFMLTLMSAVFLPLNLIVGFFGMNTENLFFKDNHMGTQYVLAIIIGSLCFSVFGLPIIRFVDTKIVRLFLGRSNIYNKISHKIETILKVD
ncbi:MAG: magnesium transporter [Bacteriovoracaceae bacterium]|jgi:magnesium transporter